MDQVCAHAQSCRPARLARSIGKGRQGIVGQGIQAVAAGILLREADEELGRGRERLLRRPVQEHGAPKHRIHGRGHKAEAPGQQDGKTPGLGQELTPETIAASDIITVK